MAVDIETKARQTNPAVVRTMHPPPAELLHQTRLLWEDDSYSYKGEAPYDYLVDRPGVLLFFTNRYGCGFGDNVMDLRQAAGFARHFPDKEFVKLTTDLESVVASPFLDLPPNVHNDFPEGSPFPLDIRDPDPRVSVTPDEFFFNVPDVNVIFRIERNGRTFDPELFYQSIFTISPEQLAVHPITSDILILPDAKLLPSTDRTRSTKSISAGKWAEVFSKLDPALRIAIVIGTSHPEYCEAVVETAHQAGIKSVETVQGSIDDVIHAILSTRKFVGMDSGTTHLAAEVIKAARAAGRTIDFRELFLEGTFRFEDYGIADPEGLYKTLVYTSTELGDLDGIDAETVAEFIKS